MRWRRKWQPTPVFLPGESQGWGAWWAAVYGVAQSRTRLKRLSSSRSTFISYVLEGIQRWKNRYWVERLEFTFSECFLVLQRSLHVVHHLILITVLSLH